MESSAPVRIQYFSDVLCVWAYAAQIRLDELIEHFGPEVEVSYHFLPLFACTEERIGQRWKDRGGYAGYGEHVQQVCERFPHAELHPQVWSKTAPRSSASAHHFLKALQILEDDGQIDAGRRQEFDGRTFFEEAMWRVRTAFFRDSRDISTLECQLEIAAELDLPKDPIVELMTNGEAMASLFHDIELRDRFGVRGSPTYVLNEGRQLLYGNVGYRVIEANVQEILRRPEHEATWC